MIDAPSIASRARARSAGLRLRLTLESSEMVSVIISTTGADRVGRWVPTWPRVSAGDAPGSLNSADASHWTNGADMMTRPCASEHSGVLSCVRSSPRKLVSAKTRHPLFGDSLLATVLWLAAPLVPFQYVGVHVGASRDDAACVISGRARLPLERDRSRGVRCRRGWRRAGRIRRRDQGIPARPQDGAPNLGSLSFLRESVTERGRGDSRNPRAATTLSRRAIPLRHRAESLRHVVLVS